MTIGKMIELLNIKARVAGSIMAVYLVNQVVVLIKLKTQGIFHVM
jgi:hypothetical protein